MATTFYVLATVTEEFFVPSIDEITKKLKLSSDAAGATLLAIGSSAPEFFTSLFAVFGIAGAASDIGAGAIVGSAIFNVLVIIGIAAMFRAVKLQWQPVVRDQLFYIITILMLLIAFWDGKIVLYEAIMFVMTYVLYVVLVINWRKILPYEDQLRNDTQKNSRKKRFNALDVVVKRALSVGIPNPKTQTRLYPITFVLSILTIAGLSWILVSQVVIVAEIANINATFLALTLLAAGTSVPDLISSIIVAKQGRGDMAVSNAIGSNIFDILFGLGLPWLLFLTFKGSEAIEVSRDNLLASIFLLGASVIATLFILITRNWRIGHKSGLMLIGLYIGYCVYILLTVA